MINPVNVHIDQTRLGSMANSIPIGVTTQLFTQMTTWGRKSRTQHILIFFLFYLDTEYQKKGIFHLGMFNLSQETQSTLEDI